MPTPVSVSREHLIPASLEAVWAVISEPSMQERIDPRGRATWQSGDAGAVSSAYGIELRSWLGRAVEIRMVVTESEPGVALAWDGWYRDRRLVEQRGEIVEQDDGILLRWTVTQWPGPLLRRVARRKSESELPLWLAAVEREALAR